LTIDKDIFTVYHVSILAPETKDIGRGFRKPFAGRHRKTGKDSLKLFLAWKQNGFALVHELGTGVSIN